MRRSRAAAGSVAFFVVAPGVVAGVIPWLITRWRPYHPLPYWVIAQVFGAAVIVAGVIPLVSAFVEFVKAGGTPMPLAPTQELVVTGFNRYVRNPMYVGVVLTILGQALLWGSLGLVVYALVPWAATAAFVHWYEEPTLTRVYGTRYEAYRRAVPAWWPRLRPWTPPSTHTTRPR